MKQKAVIIGGGLGGLFTGAFLSKEGVEVTVLEKTMSLEEVCSVLSVTGHVSKRVCIYWVAFIPVAV